MAAAYCSHYWNSLGLTLRVRHVEGEIRRASIFRLMNPSAGSNASFARCRRFAPVMKQHAMRSCMKPKKSKEPQSTWSSPPPQPQPFPAISQSFQDSSRLHGAARMKRARPKLSFDDSSEDEGAAAQLRQSLLLDDFAAVQSCHCPNWVPAKHNESERSEGPSLLDATLPLQVLRRPRRRFFREACRSFRRARRPE